MDRLFKNFKRRDLVVVLVSILALTALFVAIRFTRQKEQENQEALVESVTGSSSEQVENTSSAQSANGLIINEISSNGAVEIYNGSSKSVDLSGYSIYVGNDQMAVIADNTTIDGKSLVSVETGCDLSDTDNNIIKLLSSDGELVKALYFDAVPTGSSYGCITDGSYEAGFITSTIGESNETSERIEVDDIVFSIPGGFYDDSFEIEITAPDNCTIYYTVDGTVPTTESSEYSSKIYISRPSSTSYVYAVSDGAGYTYTTFSPESVDMGMVVSAIAVDASGEVLYSKTASYFIGYKEDTDYTGLPVLSIVGDPAEIFGFDEGIYVPGKSYYEAYVQKNNSHGNYYNGGTADIQIEYYEANKDLAFSCNATMSIYNDGRRAGSQKSLRLKSTDSYPTGTSLDNFLNNTSNSLMLLSGGWETTNKIRNYLVNGLVEGTSVITKEYSPCIVFINGEYWGMYTLATNYDKEYFARNYDVEGDVITVTSEYSVPAEYTSFYTYVVNTDFSISSNYEELKTRMDVSNYIEYMCTNIYIGNTALGRYESACVWRTVDSTGDGYNDGRWRWALSDVTSTLGNTSSFLDPYTKGDYSAPIINTYLSSGVSENEFFNSLIQSDEFVEEYKETMNRLIENNFTQAHADSILEELDGWISNAVTATNARFSSSQYDLFAAEVKMLNSYFDKRTSYITEYTQEYMDNKGDVPGKLAVAEDEETEGVSETEEIITE